MKMILDKKYNAVLLLGKPLNETPKSYKYIGVYEHNCGNSFNSSLIYLFENSKKQLKYGIYRYGCFYPYYGNIIIEGFTYESKNLKYRDI